MLPALPWLPHAPSLRWGSRNAYLVDGQGRHRKSPT
jgi:hypothetical protein